MTQLRLIFASLWFHRRANFAVACGVGVAVAVLTGALLVGDSMRGSLRRLTLDRLGRIDEALLSEHFFRAAAAEELPQDPASAAPAILLRASLENAAAGSKARANRVALIGCDERFWRLGEGAPPRPPDARQIVLNRPLAEQLGVGVGDSVLLRLPHIDAVPADSALGRKRDTVRTQRLAVSKIVEAQGLGRFAVRSTQRLPSNAYVSLAWLQQRLDLPERVNAVFLSGKANPAWRPQLADYGLDVQRTGPDLWTVTSQRMVLDPIAEQIILDVLAMQSGPARPAIQPALTYVANTLACNGREIPYSTITAIDFAERPPLGPFVAIDGEPLPPLGPDEIALNSWAADDLHAKPGDTIDVTYFEPESIDAAVREKTVALRLAAVVKLAGPAADRTLTPTVRGVTDERTMAQWDPPFPFDAKRIRPADDAYWDEYGPTPKAFVSLATGRRLWASRFGHSTSLRIAEEGKPPVALDGLLQAHLDPAAMGLAVQPIKQEALAASAGTTPFGVLFLGFSFFLIAAAVMLVALLFRLGVERRAAEIGTLLAVGFARRQVVRLLLGEGVLVAAFGSLLGIPLGIGYAALMLWGLRTWWLAAVSTPFLQLHMTPTSLAIGSLAGLAIAALVIGFSARRLVRLPPRRLLAGRTIDDAAACRRRSPRYWLQAGLIAAALLPTMGLLAIPLHDEARAGAFFGSGAVALAALLWLVGIRLDAGEAIPWIRRTLAGMAMRNLARNPGRSTLTIGLVAAAAFLIVAIGAFRLDPSRTTPSLHSGDGGFALVAESDRPLFADLNTPAGRASLGFSADDERLLSRCTICSLRVRAGDDASCLNLYRPRQPRVLAVPQSLVTHDGFAWAAQRPDDANPWQLLDRTPDDEVPVILEKNTANYALNLWGGLDETFEIADGHGRPLRLHVAALLADGIFQGDLLIGEQAFLRCFPDTSGYHLFLVETPPNETDAVRQVLERTLGDFGLAAETTGQRRAEFLAVQNTYLSTFQSLGGLGLLLGTLGLAAVQLRNVFERRGELALMRAVGFRRRRLAALVMIEHAALLTIGLGIGLAAALLAVLPHLVNRAEPLLWASSVGMLAAVFLLGLAAGGLAVRAVLRAPLLQSLREER